MKVCSKPGCPWLTESGRCDSCRREAEQARGSATDRGYDWAWQKTRREYLELHPLCSGDGCLELATDVDHIDGLGPHGPRGHDPTNLRGLCHRCHSKRTARDQPGGWHAGL